MSEHALAVVNEAKMDVPDAWDRTAGDSVVAFGKHMPLRWEIAQGIAKSGMTHHKTPEAVMTIALTAFEMGLPLMQALRGMYVVDGKIAIEGHLMDALAIQRCGVRKTIHLSDRRACKMSLHRDGWDSVESSFTLEDAKLAGLIKEFDEQTGTVTPAVSRNGKAMLNWHKHTEEMLYWRALSKGLKRIAPDYFGGVYHLDELQEATVIAEGTKHVSTNDELDALAGDEPKTEVEPPGDPEPASEQQKHKLRELRKLVNGLTVDEQMVLADTIRSGDSDAAARWIRKLERMIESGQAE